MSNDLGKSRKLEKKVKNSVQNQKSIQKVHSQFDQCRFFLGLAFVVINGPWNIYASIDEKMFEVSLADKDSKAAEIFGKLQAQKFPVWMVPIGSMYGIFSYIYHENQANVGKYTIHGW